MPSRPAAGFAALALCLILAACQTGPFGGPSATGASQAGLSQLETIRSRNGLSALQADRTLETAARRQAAYMASAGRMAHDTGRGRDFVSRMQRDSVAPPAAENIAHGRMELPQVFSMWMDSPGHRSNMLDARFSRFGLAHAPGEGGRRYWALVMAP